MSDQVAQDALVDQGPQQEQGWCTTPSASKPSLLLLVLAAAALGFVLLLASGRARGLPLSTVGLGVQACLLGNKPGPEVLGESKAAPVEARRENRRLE
jgi:hypothetical protein